MLDYCLHGWPWLECFVVKVGVSQWYWRILPPNTEYLRRSSATTSAMGMPRVFIWLPASTSSLTMMEAWSHASLAVRGSPLPVFGAAMHHLSCGQTLHWEKYGCRSGVRRLDPTVIKVPIMLIEPQYKREENCSALFYRVTSKHRGRNSLLHFVQVV